MKNLGLLFAGIGAGILLGAFISRVFNLEWLAVSFGAVLLILGGAGMTAQNNKR